VHAILARNLCPTPPVSDLFGRAGRHWLPRQDLPEDEADAVQSLLRQLDFHGQELAVVDRQLAGEALGDPVVARLMTIPGVDAIAAISILAAVGDFTRRTAPAIFIPGYQRDRVAQRPLPARRPGPWPLPDRPGRALKCLYLVIRSLDPTGRGRARWAIRWKPALNAFAITFEGRIVPSTTN
jgi:hypothetical protein